MDGAVEDAVVQNDTRSRAFQLAVISRELDRGGGGDGSRESASSRNGVGMVTTMRSR